VIRIVKDPVTQEEAYTVELEIESEEAKGLLREVFDCPMGKELMTLLNQAKFIPNIQDKTLEELKAEMENEEKERQEHEAKLKAQAADEMLEKVYNELRQENHLHKFFESLNFERFCKIIKGEKEEPVVKDN